MRVLIPAFGLGDRPLVTGGIGAGAVFVLITDYGVGLIEGKWQFDDPAGGWILDVQSAKWFAEFQAEFWDIGEVFVDLRDQFQGQVTITGPLHTAYSMGNLADNWLIGSVLQKWSYSQPVREWSTEEYANQSEFSFN